jgi:hypothetical protein
MRANHDSHMIARARFDVYRASDCKATSTQTKTSTASSAALILLTLAQISATVVARSI